MNKLQYTYSVAVFLAVFASAYLMLDREGSGRSSLGVIYSATASEDQPLDPALSSLFEVEEALARHTQERRQATSVQE